MLQRLVVSIVLVASAARAHAGGAFLPPLEVEVGAASISERDGSRALATQWMVGVSWASAYPKPTPLDVSIGVIGISAGDGSSATAAGVEKAVRPDEGVDAVGGFLDVALRVEQGRHWRAWAGVRGELMGQDGVGVLGAAGRVSVELWRGVAVGGGGGGIVGTLAVSAWAELGVRERPDRSLASTTAAGLGIRLPLVVGH